MNYLEMTTQKLIIKMKLTAIFNVMNIFHAAFVQLIQLIWFGVLKWFEIISVINQIKWTV